MTIGIVKNIMPRYFQEALYSAPKVNDSTKKKVVKRNYSGESLKQVMIRHHLGSIQNAVLITQTYIMPFIFIVSLAVPLLRSGTNLSHFLSPSYFGLAFIAGLMLAVMGTGPATFLGVGISLEKENFTFIKALPFNMKNFILQKFTVLYLAQVSVPILFYLILSLFVLKLNIFITLMFALGYMIQAWIQGQFMFKRDYDNLNLHWQDISQLFTRGNSQWLMMGIMMGAMIFGSALIGLMIFLSFYLKQALIINLTFFIISVSILSISQFIIKVKFWDKLYTIKE
ncbi:ABC transporter permease protein [Streptococcus parauberis KCTC 11537]|nr:ABC transporter permease protein [Streptococcus parauberis KCTC 11537]